MPTTLESKAREHFHELARTLFVALGFAALFRLWIIASAVEVGQTAIYHWDSSPSNLLIPVAVDFLAFWRLLAALLTTTQRAGRWRAVLWGGPLFFTPLFMSQNLHSLDPRPVTPHLNHILIVAALIAPAALGAGWRANLTD